MADNIMDVGPVDMGVGYGNADSAGFYALQKELLRRSALARQDEQDAAARQKDALAAEVARENIASLKTQREGQAQLNAEKAQTMAAVRFATSHGVGDALRTPADQAEARQLFGPNAVTHTDEVPGTVTPAQPAVPAQDKVIGVPDEMGVGAGHDAAPAIPATDEILTAPKPASDTFAGTEAQQEKASAKEVAHGILNGDYDTGDEDSNAVLRGWALSTLMTGKATSIPAGILNPKSASEKDSTRYFNTRAAQKLGTATKPEDVAFADSYEKLHPTQATRQNDRITIQLKGQEFQKTQRTSRELFTVKNKFRNDIATESKELAKDLERVDRAENMLQRPNWVADAVAAPEVLQIVAGGMGTGLRMTDAELNRINAAQSKLDQFRGKLSKWVQLPGEDKVTIEAEMRKNMQDIIGVVARARNRHDALLQDTLLELEDATSEPEVDTLRSSFMGKRRDAVKLGDEADKKGSETAEDRRARIRKAAGL